MTNTLSTNILAGAAYLAFAGAVVVSGYKANHDRMVHNAVEAQFHVAPATTSYNNRQRPMIEVARDKLAGTNIPRYVPDAFSVDTGVDMYLREVVRRTREIRPDYKLGDKGPTVLPDLRGSASVASR